jgi:hypothetical protein
MEREEIIQLINEVVESTKTSLVEQMNASINGVVVKMNKENDRRFSELQQPSTKETTTNPESMQLSVLQQELEALKNEREAEKQSAISLKRENALMATLGKREIKAPDILRKHLLGVYGDKIVEEDSKWYVKNGDVAQPLTKVIDEFLSSDDGAVFVPPASTVQGNGSTSGNVQPKVEKPKSLDQLLVESLRTK